MRVFPSFLSGLVIGWFYLAPAATRAAEQPPTTTIFTGATIIDGTGGTPLENATLLIQGDRIKAIGSDKFAPSIPSGARTVDLHGKTIIPGLISAHSHLGLVNGASTASAENYTRENVARQLAQYERLRGDGGHVVGCQPRCALRMAGGTTAGQAGRRGYFHRGPRARRGGRRAAFPACRAIRFTARSMREEARADVREMAARHPDLIKLWLDDVFGTLPKMAPEVFRPPSRKRTPPRTRRTPTGCAWRRTCFYLADAKALVDAGVDVLAHSVRDRPVDAAFVSPAQKPSKSPTSPRWRLMNHSSSTPTIPTWMDTPFFTAAVDPALLATWLAARIRRKTRARQPDHAEKPRRVRDRAEKRQNAARRRACSSPWAPTPARCPRGWPGLPNTANSSCSSKRVSAPMDAHRCRHRPQRRGDRARDDRGTLTPGKRADFLVLEANPLDDIHNTTRLASVWHGGRQVLPLRGPY